MPNSGESPWRFCPMHPRHLDAVLAIEQRAYPIPWSRNAFEDCLRVGYSAWVLTDTTGRVLGYGLMTLAVDEAHLLNLCIDPPHQGQGLGRRLLEHLASLAAAAGAERLLLEVRVSNAPALALYRSAGFTPIGLRKRYYPTLDRVGEDAHVLERRLLRSP